jgi:hypothetical protein
VEELLPFMKVGQGMSRGSGEKSGEEAPKASQKSAATFKTFYRWGESWTAGKKGEVDAGEVSSMTSKGNEGGKKDEWARGLFEKGREKEGKEKVTGIKEMDEWARGMFRERGGERRSLNEIAKEDVEKMRAAWKEDGEKSGGGERGDRGRVTDGVLKSVDVRETHDNIIENKGW